MVYPNDFLYRRTLSILPRRIPIERLSSKQRAHLRSLSHDLDPVVHVGKDGLSEAVIHAVKEAFNTRELMKIRVLAGDVNEVSRTLADTLEEAHIVQVIGHVVVLYRPHPDQPEIELPG